MDYWIEGKSENGFGENGILLESEDANILSVVKNQNGIKFMEECDGWFSRTYTKDEALKLIDELKEWVNLQ
jgi:hypothetical protein